LQGSRKFGPNSCQFLSPHDKTFLQNVNKFWNKFKISGLKHGKWWTNDGLLKRKRKYTHARIIDFDTKERSKASIKVELYFKTGPYKRPSTCISIFPSTSYPIGDEKVVFLTPILHPAVDQGNIEVLVWYIFFDIK
jgi:hypothetical protein